MPGAGVPSGRIIYYISNICRMSGEETVMVMLMYDEDCATPEQAEHNRKIADYLNRHPMFRDAGSGAICKRDFFRYINTSNRLRDASDDPDRLEKIDRAIWISGDYAEITEDDCDWFFGLVEGLWRECYGVPGSGFFDRPDSLPVVPKGLLKIPDKI